jgi:hypothetical protein
MANHRYRVQATFPELPAAAAQLTTTVHAPGWAVAARRSEDAFRTKTRGRRITIVELRVVKLPDEEKE